jgi:cellulose synthase/poly-beta-1,6-N-acetylglucosamine synthase-like glycosyltransferase
MLMLQLFFWLIFGLILHTYFIYPLVLIMADRRAPAPPKAREDYLPVVTLIVAAHNEQKVIEEKIRNCLAIDYPKDLLQIFIGSDGSKDRTVEIVSAYKDKGVRLFDFEHRRGKVSVLNDLVQEADGEVLVFSDANTIFESGSLKKMVRYFADPSVGGVCGKLVLKKPVGFSGEQFEGLYWKYETFLKVREGRLGVLLGANGAIYAIRKKHYFRLEENTIIDDFMIPMRILQKGFKIYYEPEAVAYEEASRTIAEEQLRKRRIGAGAYQALVRLKPMLNICERKFAGFAYWSHKVLRWSAPFLMIALLLVNGFLLEGTLYRAIFFAQVALYSSAAIGYLLSRSRHPVRLFSFFYYFVATNLSLLIGFFRFVGNRQSPAWERVER